MSVSTSDNLAGQHALLDSVANTTQAVLRSHLDGLNPTTSAPAGQTRPDHPGRLLARVERMKSLTGAAAGATTASPRAGHWAGAGADQIQPLSRLTMALRALPESDRRHLQRLPYRTKCTVTLGGTPLRTETLDIGLRGLLVRRLENCQITVGAKGTIAFDEIGSLAVRVVQVGPTHLNLVANCKLSPIHEAALSGLTLRLKGENDLQAGQVRALAATVSALFERSIQAGKITAECLLDRTYREVAGTCPQQYTTQATAFYEANLPQIFEQFIDFKAGMIYAVITDKDGYVPVHNPPYNQEQRPDDLAFNRIYARQRRIYDDEVTLRAARFARDVVIQTYARDVSSGPGTVVKDIAAPIFVRGRRWGCAELAYALECEQAG